MRKLCIFLLVLSACTTQGICQFFPKGSVDWGGGDFKSQWYSWQLRALKEPSLLQLSKDTASRCYRFLWLRSFNHPVAIRINIRADGTGVLTTKVASGEGGFRPGALILNESRPLTSEEARSFLAQIKKTDFWNLPNPVNDQTGTDGSQWVIEGVEHGRYHVVDRWMPKAGPIHELGVTLAFKLAKLKIPQNEIY